MCRGNLEDRKPEDYRRTVDIHLAGSFQGGTESAIAAIPLYVEI